MFSRPSLVLVSAMYAGVLLAVALVLLPPDAFWSRVAPERYLAGARVFEGPAQDSDAEDAGRLLSGAVVAWRRLARAGDTVAFRRLVEARAPAARLYGLAGIHLLTPESAGDASARVATGTDSVTLSWACAWRRVPVALAVRELTTDAWPATLLHAPPGCRAHVP